MLGFLKREGERGNGDEVSLVRDESIFPKNEVEIVRDLLWQTLKLDDPHLDGVSSPKIKGHWWTMIHQQCKSFTSKVEGMSFL